MEDIRNKIISFLGKESIEVLYFNHEQYDDFLVEKPAELAIRIKDEDFPKWQYFLKKVNSCGRVVSAAYFDGILKFIFEGTGQACEEELLKHNLEIFYEKLEKRYFTVCPSVETFSVLPKPTHRCNLDCRYCYDKPYRETIKEDMSMEVLDRLLKLLSGYTEKVVFIWHGGEPTMVGLEWYRKAYSEVFPKYPMLEYEFSMMSNGTNYNDDWFDFFEKYDIEPGASYNSYYQTQLRCSSQSDPDLQKELEKSERIKEYIIKAKERGLKIGVIDVITGLNYKNQIDIYEYYKKLNISLCMNHIFHTKQTEKNHLEISAKEYTEEFLKYFKYWLYDKDGMYERSAEEALALVIGAVGSLTCKYEDCRYKWLGINPRGELYPCDRYYPEKYRIGTVFDYESINDIFASEVYQMFSCEVQKRFDTKCRECGFWFACKGDCSGSALESSGSCEGVEEFVCELFRLKYIGVYEILRDLDWVGNKEINPCARSMLMNKGFYSVREIKQFMKDVGMKFKLEYNRDNFLQCSEYQVFRGINFMADDDIHKRHIDFSNSFDKYTVKLNTERRRRDLIDYLKWAASDAVVKSI